MSSSNYKAIIEEARKQKEEAKNNKNQPPSSAPANNETEEKLETRKQDSQEQYTKVAMRLSTEAADKLKRWRLETKIPYEILLDVLIRQQGDLTEDQLKEARTIRQQRLLEGKQKSLESTKQKLDF